jgi:integrase
MPTVRKPSRGMWPKYLYCRRGYFSWRDPATSKEYPLGKDEAYAVEQARDMNARLSIAPPPVAQQWPTLGEFLPTFREHLAATKMAQNTRYTWTSRLKAFARLSHVRISKRYEDAPAITQACAEFLADYVKAGKHRQAKSMRAGLFDLFAHMGSKGWLATNPIAIITDLPDVKVKRERLTLEQFRVVYDLAPQVAPWLRNAMELAIVTVQSLDEVANMKFRDVQDGRLHVVRGKTDAHIRIPLGLRLDAVGWSVDDAIRRCKNSVLSPYLVHHIEHQGQAKPGMRVNPQTLSKAFSAAVERAGIKAPDGKTPPTFHELRSLGIRLYKAESYNPQDLAGHKQASTTDLYRDSRGAEWIEVRAK